MMNIVIKFFIEGNMNKFSKLNRLSLMLAVGALMTLSTELSANHKEYCDIGVAIEEIKKKNPGSTCQYWPFEDIGEGEECFKCLDDLEIQCGRMPEKQFYELGRDCEDLGELGNKKGKTPTPLKSHTH